MVNLLILSLNNGKKSQSGILILVGIVVVFILMWMINMYATATQQERLTETVKLSKISKYMDFYKGYSRESLLLATHTTAKQVAAQGGNWGVHGGTRHWICNGPLPPEVDEVRAALCEATQNYFNFYTEKLEVSELTDVNVTNATCVDHAVDSGSVMSGQNDERFIVNEFGSIVNISYELDNVQSGNDISIEVAQIRFWYMYREFKAWSQSTSFPSCVCGCLGAGCSCDSGDCILEVCPQFNSCVDNCFNKAANELEGMFDEYIDCGYSFTCCYIETEIVGFPEPGCNPWEDPPFCPNCRIEVPKELCIDQMSFSGTEDNKKYDTVSFDDELENKIMWIRVKTAIQGGFDCKDKKYLLSTSGSRYLTFAVNVMMSIRGTPCIVHA